MNCYCGSSKDFKSCCEPLLNGDQEAETAEQLMRSRYSAFCVKNMDYVVETTDPQKRGELNRESTMQWMNGSDFLRLEILNSKDEGNKGTVEFKAYFKDKGSDTEELHHEISKFRQQGGTWYFRDGKVFAKPEPAKN